MSLSGLTLNELIGMAMEQGTGMTDPVTGHVGWIPNRSEYYSGIIDRALTADHDEPLADWEIELLEY